MEAIQTRKKKYCHTMQIPLFAIVIALASPNPPEQIAFDYFAKEILSKNYPKIKQAYFSGHSEAERTVTEPFNQCFDLNNFNKPIYNYNDSLSSLVDLSFNKAIIRKVTKIKTHGLNLLLYRAVGDGKFSYTYIQAYKPNHFVDHYLIKIDSATGEVVDTCRVPETI